MIINMIGSFIRNFPFGTELAFVKGLRQLGHDVNTWDPSSERCPFTNNPDAVIVFKDHGELTYGYLSDARNKRIPTIEYQPDDIRAPGILGMMEHMRQYCDYAFSFDTMGAFVAEKQLGYRKAKCLLVTADPDVYYKRDITKDVDFCFIGSFNNPKMHHSRRHMMSLLLNNGFQVARLSTYNTEAINAFYNRSKIIINHATDVGQDFGSGYGYQCRHFEAGMAGTMLLSNKVLGDGLSKGPSHFCNFYDEQSLLFWAKECLDERVNKGFTEGFVEEIHEKHMPIHRAKEIIDFIEEIRS